MKTVSEKKAGSEDQGVDRAAVAAMTRARAALVLDHPFFGSLALRLRFKADAGCRDLWTDGRTLGFNPVFAASMPEKTLMGAQAHEIMHLACGHHVRRKGRDATLWNRACDYAVNHILLEAGFSLPEGFLHNPEYAGYPVDDIYVLLSRLQERESNHGAEKGAQTAAGSGQGTQGHVQGEENDAGAETSGREGGQEEGEGEGGLNLSAVRAAENESESGESGPSASKVSFTGEVRDLADHMGQDQAAAQKAAEREAYIALAQAVQRALHMGDMPAGFMRLVKNTLRPGLDWKAVLQRFLENCADSDYSWTMPNRRYLHQDIYLPSRHESRIPGIVLAVDSSGSVDEAALEMFCAEFSSMLEAYDTTLTVLFHDTRVQASHTVGRADLPLSLAPVGGGGTDYRPVGEHIREEMLAPACVIWFTDLQCNRFPQEPDCPVLWVSTMPADPPPPFGQVLCLPGLN